MEKFVQWHLTGTGYGVTVYDGECQPIHEYTAGDHPLDSQSVAPKGRKLPKRTLIKFAKQTAGELADEYEIPHARISRDTDTENDLAEERG